MLAPLCSHHHSLCSHDQPGWRLLATAPQGGLHHSVCAGVIFQLCPLPHRACHSAWCPGYIHKQAEVTVRYVTACWLGDALVIHALQCNG